ncbi:MAG: hypothetical protein IJ150_00150 [Bacteroidales bacterium]|nr:hypothetical protein [Bacteroidales bacterium]
MSVVRKNSDSDPADNAMAAGFATLAYIATEEQIGCKLTSLQAKKWEYKQTRRCTITKLDLIRKKQQNRRV